MCYSTNQESCVGLKFNVKTMVLFYRTGTELDWKRLRISDCRLDRKSECCCEVYFFTCTPSFNVSNVIVFFRTEQLNRTTVSQTCTWSGESRNRRSYPTELLFLLMSSNSHISRLIQGEVSCRFSVQYVKLTWWPSSVDLSTEQAV